MCRVDPPMLLCITVIAFTSITRVHTTQEFYIGAVVEYKPLATPWDSTPEELLQKNSDNYVHLIHEAAIHGADIIVFPEFGLTTLGMPRDREAAKPYLRYIPDFGSNPCDNAKNDANNLTVVEKLSCAAKSSRIYVAANLGEIRSCSNETIKAQACPEDGVHQYSTTVVFNRSGTIVAKYHKQRRFFEPQFEAPVAPQLPIFYTDFGATFGIITSYDIVYDSPAIRLVEAGVTNIIFPMVWYDQLPFLTTIQAHGMWAAGVNVNLLASGYHEPTGGQLGSGIFSGKSGILNSTNDPVSGTKIIFAEVPLNLNSSSSSRCSRKTRVDNFPNVSYTFIREDLENYTTSILDMSVSGVVSQTVCNNDLCCSLRYQPVENNDRILNTTLNYRLVARNGTRKIAQGTHHFSWQVCGILRCLNETIDSCTDRKTDVEDYVNFNFLELSGGPFHTAQVMQPSLNSLDIHYNIIPFHLFDFKIEGNSSVVISSELLRSTGIQTLAIIGRIYLDTD